MPALWQASQRPMYVRTVWVDGFRHAILSHDDPYFSKFNKRRPHSSASCATDKLTVGLLQYQNDKFDYIVTNDRRFGNSLKTNDENEIEQLNLSDVDRDSNEELVVRANAQPLYDIGSSRSKFDNIYENMKTLRSNRTSRSDVKENTELSERVLQWLDLAGKVDLLAPENKERMSQPRHSWPEIQKSGLVKSKTAADVRVREAKAASPKVDTGRQQSGIDRHDFYDVPAASTIENYARQSRNPKHTPRNELATRTKDNHKIKAKDIRSNIQEARQKIASERSALEKQYAELLNKKLIPDLNGKPKKQVHIFMPELPKRMGGSNSTSRTESLLSQFSHLTLKS